MSWLSSFIKAFRVKMLNGQIDVGARYLAKENFVTACSLWLEAWEVLKELAPATARSRQDVRQAYPKCMLNLSYGVRC